jgi:uncharacterized membrane protein
MLSLSLIFAVVILLFMLFELILPDVWRPDHLFGVPTAPDARQRPEVRALISRWRVINILLGLAGAAASAATFLLPQSSYLVILPILLVAYAAAVLAIYIAFHRQARAFAVDAAEGVNASPASTYLHSYGTITPYWWELLPLGIISLTAIVLATRYANAPAIIPIHFNLVGRADGFASKSIGSFFALVWVQLGTWVTFTLLAIGVSSPRVAPYPADDSHRRVRVRFLFVTKTGLIILMSITVILSTSAYQVGARAGQIAALVFAVNIATIVLALLLFARSGQSGQQTSGADLDIVPPGDAAADDSAWLGGLIYYNPDDPAILVPKRFGIGYTLNFARPVSWLFLIGILLIPVILALTTTH